MQQINVCNIQGGVLISVGEELVYFRVGGLLSETDTRFLTSNTHFPIGSVSKQFTAVALLRELYRLNQDIYQVQKSLKQTIGFYLSPSHPIWSGNYPEWADRVNLHQLLTHSSGVMNFTDEDAFEYEGFHASFHKPHEYLDLVKEKGLAFEPGTNILYSNTGYLLIAEVVEVLTCTDFSSYLNEMFEEIGMSGTWAPLQGDLEDLRNQDPLISGVIGTEVRVSDNFSCAKGAGGLISSLQDLLRWNVALHKNKVLLPDGLYQLLCTDYQEGEGYGIGVENSARGLVLGHQGYFNGFDSLLLYEPSSELSIIVLSNSHDQHEQIVGHIIKFFNK